MIKFRHGKRESPGLRPTAERLTFHILWGYRAGFPVTCSTHTAGGGRRNQQPVTQFSEALRPQAVTGRHGAEAQASSHYHKSIKCSGEQRTPTSNTNTAQLTPIPSIMDYVPPVSLALC